MQLEITIDGHTEVVPFDLDPNRLSLQESVRLEEAIPPHLFQQMMSGDEWQPTPRILQALVWAKLSTTHPGIARDGFDLDLSEVVELVTAAAEDTAPVVIPMTAADGEETTAEVAVEGKG